MTNYECKVKINIALLEYMSKIITIVFVLLKLAWFIDFVHF